MSLLYKTRARAVTCAAIILLLLYGLLALQAQLGALFSPLSLDPVWAAVYKRGALRVATDIGWRPFADLQNGEVVGYDIDLAREIGRRLGLRVELVPTGYDALYDALTSDRADIVAAALPYTPEYGDRARFSRFYFNAGQVLVVRSTSSAAAVADLGGSSIGVMLGSDADDLARRIVTPDLNITLVNTFEETGALLAALQRGELAGVLVDNVTALSATQRNPALRLVEPALTLEPYVLAMPPRAFQLQSAVDQVLKELEDEGFMAQLNRKWLVQE